MTKEFYDFLFDLRASGFTRNTITNARQLQYYASTQQHAHSQYLAVQNGEIVGHQLDGEVGSLSQHILNNYRYMLCCICGTLNAMADDKRISRDYAQSLSDYYINRVEQIQSGADFEAMTAHLLEDFQKLLATKQRVSYGAVLDKCIDYIDQNLYTPLRAESVARYAAYSPSYLSALFRKKTGVSLYRYIQNEKIAEAKKMLLYTSQPLTAISAALCFHSLPHFSQAFKASTGITPSAYRARGVE